MQSLLAFDNRVEASLLLRHLCVSSWNAVACVDATANTMLSYYLYCSNRGTCLFTA
ncbi:hypothetical protein [Paraburkholderia caffeinilytica]|uniref:hypothetical protein n=1 Tax=Paraburkholderia caffeinilytica TaxID=1761016 RepID=UPI0038B7CFC7